MNIHKVFPSKYLSAQDLQDSGRDEFELTIDRCTMELVGPRKDNKMVLYFQGAKKGMIMNKTNAFTIADAYGPETDNWKGNKVIVFVTMVNFQGKQTPGLRVRVNLQNGPEPQPAAEDVDFGSGPDTEDNPFDEPAFGNDPDEPF